MRTIRTIVSRSLAVTAAVGLCLAAASPASAHGSTLLRSGFEGSMPDGPTIARVDPGGAPWVLDEKSEVRVREDGRIRIRLEDLVIPALDANPVAMMKASLVCGGGVVATTPAFAVDAEGDARFRGEVWVPRHCEDPQVLIRHAVSGAYFAFTDDHGHHG